MKKKSILLKTAAFAASLLVASATSATAFANLTNDEPYEQIVDGVYVFAIERGQWAGANIILGTSTDEWPWSSAPEDGKPAFKFEAGAEYRLTFNVTSSGSPGIRVRWVNGNENGGYTSDAAVVNANQYTPDETAKLIPALFGHVPLPAGETDEREPMMKTGESYTLTVEFTADGSEPADGLIGNIAIRGLGGSNEFTINWLKMEKIDSGERLFLWDYFGLYTEPEPPQPTEPAAPEQPAQTESADSGEEADSGEAPAQDETPAAPPTSPAQTSVSDDGSGSNLIIMIILIAVPVICVIAIVLALRAKKKKQNRGFKWH